MVRHWLAHVVRLGRELLLLHAQQRYSRHRTYAERIPDGLEVVEWRNGRPGGQRLRSDRDHRGHPAAGQSLSRGEVSAAVGETLRTEAAPERTERADAVAEVSARAWRESGGAGENALPVRESAGARGPNLPAAATPGCQESL